MSYEVMWSPAAVRDLDVVWEWIAVENGEPAAAERTIAAIIGRIESIVNYPLASTPLDYRCRIHSEWRFVEERGYLAFFRVGNSCIYVDRVLSGRSDYLRKLFGVDDGTTLYD